jgi:Ser/Thr protein kinase RdoA (MazF antagonist)
MKKIMDTVDDNWRSSFVEKFLESWEHDKYTLYFLRASANFVFIFKKSQKTYFLRFNESTERDLKGIESEINILNYLIESNIDVCKPVKSLNGEYIETFNTEIGTCYAVVFEGLIGKQFETDELNTEHFYHWGKSLGNLHKTMKNIPEEYKMSRMSWKDHLKFADEILSDDELSAREELEYLASRLNDLETTNDNFGLIHYDFELDNLVWKDNLFSILDFDDCSNYWYVSDIVYALRDLIQDNTIPNNEEYQQFIVGYRSETSINDSLLNEIPLFIRLHNLITFAILTRTLDIPDSSNYPEWLLNLRAKLVDMREKLGSSF